MTDLENITLHAGSGPLVFDSPHSGVDYPADFGHFAPMSKLRVAEDTHVDALYSFVPSLDATFIAARFPRSYVDANRSSDEIDVDMLNGEWPVQVNRTRKVTLGKGLIWKKLDDGTPLYQRLLTVDEVERRIRRYWQPYHAAVEKAIRRAWECHGCCIHINCHSMPSVAQEFANDFPGLEHPDFVVGNRDYETASPAVTSAVVAFLEAKGYRVWLNHPYKGVELIRRYSNPLLQMHSLQLEVNKRLYMNEKTFEATEGFDRLAADLTVLGKELSKLAASLTPSPAVA